MNIIILFYFYFYLFYPQYQGSRGVWKKLEENCRRQIFRYLFINYYYYFYTLGSKDPEG